MFIRVQNDDSRLTTYHKIRRVEQEAKFECKAADAEHVKLYNMIPPIEKMDNALNNLKKCK